LPGQREVVREAIAAGQEIVVFHAANGLAAAEAGSEGMCGHGGNITAMTLLVAGLVLVLGAHSGRIFADPWRTSMIARIGRNPWRGIYALVSLAGFALIVWGYGQARGNPVVVWSPPAWTRHAASLLVLPAFVLIAAGNIPGTRIRAALGHPMLLGTKLWAFAHLLSNGMLADVVLFGAFLAWAIVDYASARRRDRAAGTVYPPGNSSRDATALAIGTVAWFVFGFWLHGPLIGVRPM
ncbi:MAG TPA: NnrU family protein, partial [Casimicrobiaceae bacterium]